MWIWILSDPGTKKSAKTSELQLKIHHSHLIIISKKQSEIAKQIFEAFNFDGNKICGIFSIFGQICFLEG